MSSTHPDGAPAETGSPAGDPAGAPPATNVMAILSLVFAFVVALLGLIFGIVAKRQIRQTGQGGAGLATAGIVISVVHMATWVVVLLLLVLAYLGVWAANS